MKTMITLLLLAGTTLNSHAQQNRGTSTRQSIEDTRYERNCHGGHINLTGARSEGTMYMIPEVPVPTIRIVAAPQKRFNVPGHYILTREEINQMPTTSVRDLTTLFPGVYQPQRGKDISIFGSRMDGNLYVLDGMR